MAPPADTLAELEHRIDRLIRDPATAALDAAARAIPAALAESGPALALRGELLRRGGNAEGAARLLAAAVERAPALLGAYHALALARIRAGDRAGARAAWLALLERDPDDATARYQVALAFHEDGDRGEAAHWYEAQVARHPTSPKAWHNLGLLRLAAGDAGGAVAALREAVACAPASAPAWTALGRALERAGDTPAAIGAWTRAHALDPRAVEPLERHAAALGERAALPAAIALLREAVAIEPRKPSLRFALAAHLSSLGEHADALAELRAGVALAPGDAAGHSALLFELQYDDTLATREAIADEHRRWAERHADRVPAVHRPARTRPPGRMRIGYLSPRFGMGPLATLFLPVLERHDRTRVEIVLYSAHTHDGPLNARMRAAADGWRELPRDDASAAAMIADDDLDLLVDLAGHAPGHRLGVLARRPAPLQASWLDYFETTGMDAVDYFLSDATCTPASDAPLFRERLVLLPCRFAYRPLDPPALTPAPAVAQGHVTFGSFNRHAKLSPGALDAWAAILGAVPGSRLALRAAAYGGDGTVDWIRDRWARRGLPVGRIDFLPWLPWREALAAYADVDVALDPFPYNGGATTCDALAHGVPVVALDGTRPIGRQSASLLRAAGHQEWIAGSIAGYVQIAVALARSENLDRIRRALHAALPHSALCDVERFARSLERAFEAMIAAGPRRDGPQRREPLAVA
ncbi:MAG: tetratricopeptide repeat protein [Betaproteobacteria bacterium]|nr:tetratricopeptide repeat protein [Betaproteobacteria bacterium]